MTLVVSDASPLSALSQIGQLQLQGRDLLRHKLDEGETEAIILSQQDYLNKVAMRSQAQWN